MNCTKQTTNKYKNRPSPDYPAVPCAGKTMKGKDGNMYVSKKVGKTYRWVKKVTTKKTTPKAKMNVSMTKLYEAFKKEKKLSPVKQMILLDKRLKQKKYPYHPLRKMGLNNTYTIETKKEMYGVVMVFSRWF